MKKAEGIRWSSLEADDEIKVTQFPTKGQRWCLTKSCLSLDVEIILLFLKHDTVVAFNIDLELVFGFQATLLF